MFGDIFIFLLLPETRRLADDLRAGASVTRRESHLGKLAIICASTISLLRLPVRIHYPTLAFRGGGRHVVEIGIAEARVLDVPRFSPQAEPVHIDIGQRFLE